VFFCFSVANDKEKWVKTIGNDNTRHHSKTILPRNQPDRYQKLSLVRQFVLQWHVVNGNTLKEKFYCIPVKVAAIYFGFSIQDVMEAFVSCFEFPVNCVVINGMKRAFRFFAALCCKHFCSFVFHFVVIFTIRVY